MEAERTTTQLNAQTVILLHEIFAARLFRDFQVLFSHLPKKKIPNSPYFRVLPHLTAMGHLLSMTGFYQTTIE